MQQRLAVDLESLHKNGLNFSHCGIYQNGYPKRKDCGSMEFSADAQKVSVS